MLSGVPAAVGLGVGAAMSDAVGSGVMAAVAVEAGSDSGASRSARNNTKGAGEFLVSASDSRQRSQAEIGLSVVSIRYPGPLPEQPAS